MTDSSLSFPPNHGLFSACFINFSHYCLLKIFLFFSNMLAPSSPLLSFQFHWDSMTIIKKDSKVPKFLYSSFIWSQPRPPWPDFPCSTPPGGHLQAAGDRGGTGVCGSLTGECGSARDPRTSSTSLLSLCSLCRDLPSPHTRISAGELTLNFKRREERNHWSALNNLLPDAHSRLPPSCLITEN